MFAKVILSISHTSIDRVFDYGVPNELENRIKTGMRVRVPFGRGENVTEGYVVGLSLHSDVGEGKIKYIKEIPDEFSVFSDQMISLAEWMKQRYFCTLSACLKTIMPGGIKDRTDYYVKVKYVRPAENFINYIGVYDGNKRKHKRAEVINYLEKNGEVKLMELKKAVSGAEYAIKALREEKCVEVYEKSELTEAYCAYIDEKEIPVELNEEQKAVLDLWEEERKNENRPLLIHGITGSGKTEVYIKIIEKVLSEGKQAIVLVPEISLTPLMTGRFINRFGSLAAVTHSKMNRRERFNCWKRAKDGDISVVIGPRSALFTPFDNLGVIIIDEEHEKSYISETAPAYDAVETAEKLCSITGASLCLGTATPSVKTMYRVSKKEIRYSSLKNRAKAGSCEPEIETVDMRAELEKGNRSIFSKALYSQIKEKLDNRQQIMLFINRRGYSTFVSCRSCGYVMKCGHCDVSYKYHASDNKLVCHYCGDTIDKPDICPVCGSKRIRYFGTGTQKVEDEIKKYFPNARVLRMDADTVSGKNGYVDILKKFADGGADILVGTQMIAKGHDFENVALVGVLAADMSLNTGEYDASERTYQLITQVAGRTGRGKDRGKVIIQTYTPDNMAIEAAVSGNWKEFYQKEIEYRKNMGYPPCIEYAVIELTGQDEKSVIEGAHNTADELRKYNVKILGPVPQIVSKVRDEYRWMITIKDTEAATVRKAVTEAYFKMRDLLEPAGVYLNPRIL
jgi:primosomal protein N' (replication factor Y) (superfamily II helicase)